MKLAVITVGLGFGDEGKGATVDHLCRHLGAKLVVRYSGGSQCGHNVIFGDNKQHTFSQFGAGTFAGADTYLGPNVIVFPKAMRNEAHHLQFTLGLRGILDRISVHPRCLITTKYHRAANRLWELARGKDRHGSCGHGIGEARRYWLNYGRDAIFAEDLRNLSLLGDKLELMRQRFLLDLQPIFGKVDSSEIDTFDTLVRVLAYDLAEDFQPIFLSNKLPEADTVVFEGAQGVLLDEYHGFHPHTTWSTVTMRHAKELLAEANPDKVIHLGVTRAYTTRHGAGPLPTEDEELTKFVNDLRNPWNEWQESFRAGWLHVNLLQYAAKVAGEKLDGIAVNCLDHLDKVGQPFLGRTHGGVAKPVIHRYSLAYAEEITRLLTEAEPVYEEVTVEGLLDEIANIAPLAVLGRGPTHGGREIVGGLLAH